jgi:multidrug efflux pump subunit AcrA (membrane-fusion protein)
MKFISRNGIKALAALVGISVVGIAAERYLAASPSKSTKADTRPGVEVEHPRRATVVQRLQTKATLEALEETDLFAKVSGYLSDVRVDIGDHVVNRGDLVQAATTTRTTPLFTVQRIDTIRVFCDVPENDVPHLHIGDPAIVKAYGFEGKPFSGTVTRFSLRLNPETRNMRTEIDLPNPEERLYPGMYAEVSLEMNRRPDALTVPAAAVGSDGAGNFVYTITNNRISRLAINIGLTESGRTEVTGGLSKETPVLTTFRGAPPPGTAVRPPAVHENS